MARNETRATRAVVHTHFLLNADSHEIEHQHDINTLSSRLQHTVETQQLMGELMNPNLRVSVPGPADSVSERVSRSDWSSTSGSRSVPKLS